MVFIALNDCAARLCCPKAATFHGLYAAGGGRNGCPTSSPYALPAAHNPPLVAALVDAALGAAAEAAAFPPLITFLAARGLGALRVRLRDVVDVELLDVLVGIQLFSYSYSNSEDIYPRSTT
jgi:hypothetical protein